MTESNVQNGFIGNLITGKVQTGTANKIYVTLTSGMVVEVINLRVPNTFRTCVKIGYDSNFLSGILQVLGYWYNSETKTIDAHHTQHEWPSPDTVFVKGEQFYPCLFEPIVGTMQVKIFPGVYKTPMGWKNIKSTTIIDLTSHIPSTSGNARYAIIALDASGSFAVREGVEVSGFANLAESHLPTPTTGDACVCGVMLFQGHTALRKDNNNNDFIDLRFSGASGGATNAPNITVLSVLLNSADAKTTPVDADTLPITDSAASNVLKKVTWLSIKTTLKTYFDTLYATVSHTHSTFAALSHTHSGSDIASGTLDGDRLPGLSATKKGGVPATGTPSGKYLKDDGTWATVSGGSGGGGTYGLDPIDVTSQITGSTNHFTFSPVADSILVMVDGLLQNPSNVTLDTDGLGFTLSFTPTTSDTGSLIVIRGTSSGGDLGAGSTGVIAIKTTTPPESCPAGTVQLYTDTIPNTVSNVPQMTSLTAPSGTAFGSSSYGTTPAWKAFNLGETGWVSDGSALPQWVGYEFDSPVTVMGYAIEAWWIDAYPSRSPKSWWFQGSNDGSTWDTLHQVSGFTAWIYKDFVAFTCTTWGSYKYYRLRITETGGDTYTGVSGLKLFGSSSVVGLYVKTEYGTFLLSK